MWALKQGCGSPEHHPSGAEETGPRVLKTDSLSLSLLRLSPAPAESDSRPSATLSLASETRTRYRATREVFFGLPAALVS